MKVSVNSLKLLAVLISSTNAFVPLNKYHRQTVSTLAPQLHAETAISDGSTDSSTSSVQSLGLLTFDLDDTLYPIAQIVEDANGMYSTGCLTNKRNET